MGSTCIRLFEIDAFLLAFRKISIRAPTNFKSKWYIYFKITNFSPGNCNTELNRYSPRKINNAEKWHLPNLIIWDENLILGAGYVQVNRSDASRSEEKVLQEVQHSGAQEGRVLHEGGKHSDVPLLDQGGR